MSCSVKVVQLYLAYMYIPPKKKRMYTFLATAVLVLIPVSVLGVLYYEDIRSLALPGQKPEDVRMSDITETSVVVSWITPDREVEGWLRYSEQAGVTDGSLLAQDDRDVFSGVTEKRTTHYVTLSNLQPSATYYFVIGSGTSIYKDPDGNEFTVTTASSGSDTIPTPDPVYGSVTNGIDQSAIVYITLAEGEDKSFPVSALTNDSGNFEVDLAHIRNETLDDKFDYDDSTEMIVFAQGGDLGCAVLRTSVGQRDSLSLTAEASCPETDVFNPISDIPIGPDEPDEPEPDEPEPDEPEPDEPEPINAEDGYPLGTPTTKHDVPLTALVLGSSSIIGPGTGISDILVTNVTENSFTVLWSSVSQEIGMVEYGTSADAISGAARDTRDSVIQQSDYYMHHVTVSDLVPETTYYYEIVSGSQTYDDGGLPYQITLPATEDSPPEFFSIFGEVTGTGASDAIVIARIIGTSGTSSYASSSVEDSGTWTLSLGGIRTQNYEDYFQFTDEDTIELTVRTLGNEEVETFTVAEVTDEVIETDIDMIAISREEEEFERGLYEEIIAKITSLPETAINRLTALGLTVALLLVGYGTYLLSKVYASERSSRWEKEVLRDLE